MLSAFGHGNMIVKMDIWLLLLKFRFFLLVLLIALLIAFLSGCEKQQTDSYQVEFSKNQHTGVKEYIFGVHPLHNPQRLYKVFNPLMSYLSKNIDGVEFKLEASRNYAAFDKKLAAKHFDFSLPNPFQTVNAMDNGYDVIAKMGDDENFKGIIIVRKDSQIERLEDLIGNIVSYPAPTALAATMMPQYFMAVNGIDVNKDLDNRYVGSQESAIMNVFVGDSIAAATWPPPWTALKKENKQLAEQLIVQWQTPPLINNAIVARKNISTSVKEKVAWLLANLHKSAEGMNILNPMELSQFEVATNESYDVVREFIIDFSTKVRPLK